MSDHASVLTKALALLHASQTHPRAQSWASGKGWVSALFTPSTRPPGTAAQLPTHQDSVLGLDTRAEPRGRSGPYFLETLFCVQGWASESLWKEEGGGPWIPALEGSSLLQKSHKNPKAQIFVFSYLAAQDGVLGSQVWDGTRGKVVPVTPLEWSSGADARHIWFWILGLPYWPMSPWARHWTLWASVSLSVIWDVFQRCENIDEVLALCTTLGF